MWQLQSARLSSPGPASSLGGVRWEVSGANRHSAQASERVGKPGNLASLDLTSGRAATGLGPRHREDVNSPACAALAGSAGGGVLGPPRVPPPRS